MQTKSNTPASAATSRQITYKIKDGLYLAASFDAFKDEEFILLNWIEHIVVLEINKFPFDSRLKGMYGQQGDQIVEDGQQVIQYLHFDEKVFENPVFDNKSSQPEQIPQSRLDNSLIRQLHEPSSQQTKKTKNFNTIYNFIETSHSLGSSCLIIPSNPNQQINDLSCTFSICTAYLMTKYKWSLYKALEFMSSRLKDVNLTKTTYDWLNKVEVSLLEEQTLTYNWDSYQSVEELVLRNTFLNSKKIVCDSTFSKVELNRQISSREKIKSRSKFQNPSKKPDLANNNYDKSFLNALKPILKDNLKSSLTLKSSRKRIEINTTLNLIKEYEINWTEFQYEKTSTSKIETHEQQLNAQNSIQSSKSSSFLSASRNKKISLCVSQIVSKYREQRNLSNGNYQKSCFKTAKFDYSYDMNVRGMAKKKSYYNFQSFKNISHNKAKELIRDEDEDISRILKKIKIKQNMGTLNEQKFVGNLQKTQPSIYLNTEVQNDKFKLKTERTEQINSTKRQEKQSQKIQRNHSLNIKEQKVFTPLNSNLHNSKQASGFRSQQKLRQLKHQIVAKSHQKPKLDHKKQNSIEKMNLSTQIYIKQAKAQKSFERKHSMKENIDSTQRHKEKNLMIDYEDFKEMIKKKQKSIGNLLGNHSCKEENSFNKIPGNYLSSVIQKLKKDVSQVQASMNHGQSHLLRKNQSNHQKSSGSKATTLKWR